MLYVKHISTEKKKKRMSSAQKLPMAIHVMQSKSYNPYKGLKGLTWSALPTNYLANSISSSSTVTLTSHACMLSPQDLSWCSLPEVGVPSFRSLLSVYFLGRASLTTLFEIVCSIFTLTSHVSLTTSQPNRSKRRYSLEIRTFILGLKEFPYFSKENEYSR